MNKLSKREKVMLYALCLIAIVAGAVLLLIQPQMDKGTALDAAILDKQDQLAVMNGLILQVPGLEEETAKRREDIAAETEVFLPVMSSDDLDRYITGLIQAKGLKAEELTISLSENPAPSEAVTIYRVDVVASGYASQFVSLVDTVSGTDGLRLSVCNLNENQRAEAAATPTPKPTRTPRVNRRATPTPTPTPTATPEPDTYSMQLTFTVLECDEGALDGVLYTPTPEPATMPE